MNSIMGYFLSFIRKGRSSIPQRASSCGLKLLSQPADAIVDVVFVHGLTGDPYMTWTAPGSVHPWPEILLPEKLPQARILTFGYDAYVANWREMVSMNTIGSHARALVSSLATYREDDHTNTHPIIFVVHSLGGLVCEDALLVSQNSAERHHQKILECTRAIAFLGTPHSGSSIAPFAERLARLLGHLKQTNPRILAVLQSDSEVLARIQKDFHTMMRARANKGHRHIAITCFFEELPLPGIGEVVPEHSASLPAYNAIGIHSNHMGMTRFRTEDDPGFVSVVGELRRWVKELKLAPEVPSGVSQALEKGDARTAPAAVYQCNTGGEHSIFGNPTFYGALQIGNNP